MTGGSLKGGTVRATDLRGGAALVVAGLAAEGESLVYGYPYISRGYEDICRDLHKLGARAFLKEEEICREHKKKKRGKYRWRRRS